MEDSFLRKIILVLCTFFVSVTLASAQDNRLGPGTGNFVIGVDAAYYPKTDKVAGDTHFAPLTGAYSAFELRGTGTYNYVIPVPFSNHPLLRGNTLTLSPGLELTPVSIAPKFDVAFSPIAFLVFYAGGRIGTGWDLAPMGVKGLAVFDESTKEYESVVPFASYVHQWYLEGLFQFDLGAVVPGEWNHVVTQARYKFLYEGLWNAGGSQEFWRWQGTAEKASGWQYQASVVVGYQMPLLLQLVGVQFEFEGYFDRHDFPDWAQQWEPAFMKVGISPVMNLQFNEKHSLMVQFRFRSRRSLSTEVPPDAHDFFYEYAGREWFFDRIGLSYTCKL